METMNWVDITMLSIIGISILISIYRGLTKEMITLVTWVIAGLMAFFYGEQVGVIFSFIQTVLIRNIFGSIFLFGVIVLVGAVINIIVGRLVKLSGAGALDKVTGAIFGLVRGTVVIAALVTFLVVTPIVEQPSWKQSTLAPKFKVLADAMLEHVPDAMKEKFSGHLSEWSV